MKIKWFGHASFLIKSKGKNIYLDPFKLPETQEKADLILISHDHFDHCDLESVEKIQKDETLILTTEKAVKKLGKGKPVKEWEKITLDNGMVIETVPAYNTNKPFHPKGSGLGFIINLEGKRIYFAGDTDFIPEMMKLGNIDIAMLPIGGTYTMDIEEAVEATLSIKPKIVIPMHYNSLDGLEVDVDVFKNKVEKESLTIKIETLENKELEY